MRRLLAILAFALMTSFALTACGAMPDRSEGSGSGVSADEAEAGAPAESIDSNRHVITTARATIVVDDPSASAEDLAARTQERGGHVDQRRERAGDDGATRASLTVRVPAEALDAFLAELDELGEVTERSQSAQDVTGTVRDLDARIGALEVSIDRLEGIMAEAGNSTELLEAEEMLSERQGELESLIAERNALGEQVEMSTLEVELIAAEDRAVEPGGFLGGLQSGWNALLGFVNVLFVALGALLPWLIVLALPGFLLYRLLRKRARRRAASRPPMPVPAGHAPRMAPAPGGPVPGGAAYPATGPVPPGAPSPTQSAPASPPAGAPAPPPQTGTAAAPGGGDAPHGPASGDEGDPPPAGRDTTPS